MVRQGDIHYQRWRALTLWVVIFTAVVVYSLISLRHQANDIKNDKATIQQLHLTQSDSCKNYLALRDVVNEFHSTIQVFLKTARDARIAAYKLNHHPEDKEAAKVYDSLLDSIHLDKEDCAQRR
jgi:hypothetical protein